MKKKPNCPKRATQWTIAKLVAAAICFAAAIALAWPNGHMKLAPKTKEPFPPGTPAPVLKV